MASNGKRYSSSSTTSLRLNAHTRHTHTHITHLVFMTPFNGGQTNTHTKESQLTRSSSKGREEEEEDDGGGEFFRSLSSSYDLRAAIIVSHIKGRRRRRRVLFLFVLCLCGCIRRKKEEGMTRLKDQERPNERTGNFM